METKERGFDEYLSDKKIVSKLEQNGITKMFPIQEQSFKLILEGNDILASDRTGSGKTLAYTLPILERFNQLEYHQKQIKNPKFLILCPTRYPIYLFQRISDPSFKWNNEIK